MVKHKPLAVTYKRALANIIDYLIFMMFVFVYAIYFGEETSDGFEVSGFMVFPIPIVWFCYFVVSEGIWQATPGHQMFDIVVCQEDFNKIDIGHAMKRRIMDPIDLFFFGIPAILVSRSNDKRQRVGDVYAKTIVVLDLESDYA